MAKKVKRYEFRNFEQLLNVLSDENIDVLSLDIMQWLYNYLRALKITREAYPEFKDKSNWGILPAWIIWYDDGKNEEKGWEFHIKDTGEVVKIGATPKKQKEISEAKAEYKKQQKGS